MEIELPEDMKSGLVDILGYLENKGIIDPYDYTGFWEDCENKPLSISFGDKVVLEINYVMNVNENGEYDGVQGLNY